MIPTVQNTLDTLDQDLLVKIDQFGLSLDIYGKFNPKILSLILIIKKLLLDDNVSDNDKLLLNYKLLKIKNIKTY